MHRTEGANNIGNLFVDSLPGTRVEENWLNATQEEICGFIEGAGLTLKTAITETRDQLNTALRTVFAPMIAGTKMWFYQDVAPAGWTLDVAPGDELLAVKGGAEAYNAAGGTVAGTWTVAGLTKDAHTHAFTQPGGHNNHVFTQPDNHTALALNNHTSTQPTAHGITQPTFTISAHNHNWYIYGAGATDSSYDAVGNSLNIVAGGTNLGIYVQNNGTLASHYYTDNQGAGDCTRVIDVALTNNHSGGGVNAHSFSQNITAHAGGAVDAHSAHAGGTVDAQSNATISSAGNWRARARLGIICAKD